MKKINCILKGGVGAYVGLRMRERQILVKAIKDDDPIKCYSHYVVVGTGLNAVSLNNWTEKEVNRIKREMGKE